MDQEIKRVLESREKVVWQGKINRKALTFGLIIGLVIVFIIGGIFIGIGSFSYNSNGIEKTGNGVLIGIIVLIIGLFIVLWNYFSSIVTEYAITKKRVLIKTGIIGTDFKSIYFDQIQEVLVDVGLIGKIFKVGTIKLDTGKTNTYSTGGAKVKGVRVGGRVKTKVMYTYLRHIDKPYDVYKMVQSSLSSRKESLYSGRADRESQGKY
jgi:membrane protein YdbS with pleckstrin-like domain